MRFTPFIVRVIIPVLFIAGLYLETGCDKEKNNPPPAYINITIEPNSTLYQELNVTGGWRYLDESDGIDYPSRGLIVYRLSYDQFMAYDRTPPYKPDSCCNSNHTSCTKLLVDPQSLFIVDTCTNSKYLIIDGSPFEGPSNKFLFTYITEYDGYSLYIHN